MERFYGLDLGDAESAIALISEDGPKTPEVLEVAGAKSFISAYAQKTDGTLVIGEQACYSSEVVRRGLRFKSRFLTDPKAAEDVARFAKGILGTLYADDLLEKEDESCFYIGCPAGWDKNVREQYRAIFEKTGYPPARIISESRAALVSACQSRHLQVGYDILSKPVLVVDIGSSTTDFAYIRNGREVHMQTAGEVALGGGLMDERLLEIAVSGSRQENAIRKVFEASDPWRSYCEFAARRLKEKYFSDEDYWADHPCQETVMIHYDKPLRLKMTMDQETADRLLCAGMPSLDGKSFYQVLTESMRDVRERIGEQELPELVFLTGGVSRMPAIRNYCLEVFPESVVITGTEPEFSVARGLAHCGWIDSELKAFRSELEELTASRTVEEIVSGRVDQLYRNVVDALIEPMLTEVAMPIFHRWRSGELRRLSDADAAMQEDVAAWLATEDARALMAKPIADWMKPVAQELEKHTVPICVRHGVPYTALSLSGFFTATDLDIRVDAKDVFAVGEITWLIDSIISIIVGLICGGSGLALIAGGPGGIMAGILISFLVLVLGKDKMEGAMLKADIPVVMRKLVPKSTFSGRIESISESVKATFYERLDESGTDETISRMTDAISEQIETCLTKMAMVVEIPLG